MKLKPLELALVAVFLILSVLVGWLMVADVSQSTARKKAPRPVKKPLLVTQSPEEKNSGMTPRAATKSNRFDSLLARPGERLVQFDSEEDYQRFLRSLDSSKLRLLGSLGSLHAAWIGFDDLADFDGLLGDEELGFNYLVSPPLPPGEGGVQAGAVGFRGNALEWLGITGDNSGWGKEVTVAIIDTGVTEHSALSENIRHFDLVEETGPTGTLHGHGTAVATLIAGQNEITPGVSPGSPILDIRVADTNGDSSSFKLAEGIILAADQGADVINISMGSYGNSNLVSRAVDYAYERGAIIVASSGNEGVGQPSFPAAYPEVIAVGAVDARGTLVDFSNTGQNLDITAPGLEVYAGWTDNRYIEFSGTSASAPYVSAGIATAMSEFELTANQAADYVLNYANEAGTPGTDTSYGLGHLDVGRVVNSETPGVYDIAAVSNLIETGNSNSLITVVQNQGTETITSASVTLSTPFATVPLQVASLSPGEIQTFEVPTALPANGEEFFVTTEATLNQGFQDFEPVNNVKSTTFDFSTEP